MANPSGAQQELSSTFPADTARQFWRVYPSIVLPIFMSVGDQTIVASALPAIAGALGDVERVSWLIIGYLISSSIAAPVYGYLGDAFGRRTLLFIALAIFMIGAICCAMAPSMNLLIAARILQGLGGGGLMAMAQALLAEVLPPRERGKYQGYTSGIFVLASAIGPVVGAFLTIYFGWHAVFFINMPVGVIAGVLALRLANRRFAHAGNWSFDYAGLLFFTVFVVSLLLALEFVRRFDLSGAIVVASLIVLSLTALVLLVRQEKRTQSPLLPVGLMAQFPIWNAQIMIVCHGATMTALLAFVPLYLRVTSIGSVHDVGITLLIYSFFIASCSILVGRVVSRTGRTMILPLIGMIFTTAIFIWFAYYSAGLTMMEFHIAMAVLAIAMGPLMTVCQIVIQALAGRKLLGAAAGSIQLARTVGAVFGTALFGTILFATLAINEPEAAPMFGRILNLGPEALAGMDEARRAAIMGEIVRGFRYGFLTLAAIAALAGVLAATNPAKRI